MAMSLMGEVEGAGGDIEPPALLTEEEEEGEAVCRRWGGGGEGASRLHDGASRLRNPGTGRYLGRRGPRSCWTAGRKEQLIVYQFY